MSTSLQPEQAFTAVPIAPAGSETLPPASTSTDATPASTSATANAIPDTQKANAESITGLTPDQVFQELQKSGYIDQLRREMFDAFTASPAAKNQTAIGSSVSEATPANADSQGAPSSAQELNSSTTGSVNATLLTKSITTTSKTDPPAAPASTPTSASVPSISLDIGNKSSFLNYLSSGPLRYQVEKEHDSLRFDDARGQQSKLLKLLEIENVDYPGVEQADATLYDLLVRHIVTNKGAVEGGTEGLLSKDGKLGKDVLKKIDETVGEMVKPGGKDDEGEEEEDEEEDEEEEAEAGEENLERKPHPIDANVQPSSHQTSAQTDMDQD